MKNMEKKEGVRRKKVDYFFVSSRRRHTRYWHDWSSDVCSSDLDRAEHPAQRAALEGLDRRGPHPHRVVLGHERGVVGQQGQPPPVGTRGAGDALVDQPA